MRIVNAAVRGAGNRRWTFTYADDNRQPRDVNYTATDTEEDIRLHNVSASGAPFITIGIHDNGRVEIVSTP